MKWISLFNEIVKQPIGFARKNDVTVVLGHNDLENLLKQKKPVYEIKLDLKQGDGEKKLWFVAKRK